MFKFFFLILSFSITSLVFGQEWIPIVESRTKDTYSYDLSTIVRDGDIVTFWELIDFKTPIKVNNTVVVSSKTKMIQNCRNNEFKISDFIQYDGHNGNGNIVNIELVKTTDWLEGLPGSVNLVIKNKVCNSQSQ